MLVQAVVIALALHSPTNANDIFIEQYGDGFEMSLIQKNGSGNDFDLYSNGDYFTYDIVQDGNNNTLNLTMTGSNPINVISNQTGDNFGYSLTYSCTNPDASGACNISVIQY